MKTSFFLLLVSSLGLIHSASISERDSYENLPIDGPTENIVENLIEHNEPEHIEGLLPPLESAKDFFPTSNVRDSKYVIDSAEKVIRLQNNDPTDEFQIQGDTLKQMSAVFAEILANATKAMADETFLDSENSSDWSNVKPVITISDKGIALELGGKDQPVSGVRENGPTNEEQTTEIADEHTLVDFMSSVWDVVRTSLDYATHVWSSLFSQMKDDDTAKNNETTTDHLKGVTATATTTTTTTTTLSGGELPSGGSVFAAEEHHRLPANEFDGWGRGTGSVLYSRGIA